MKAIQNVFTAVIQPRFEWATLKRKSGALILCYSNQKHFHYLDYRYDSDVMEMNYDFCVDGEGNQFHDGFPFRNWEKSQKSWP